MSAFSLERIKGSIPPLITPFCNGAVDHDAYADLVQFQLDEGTHGILVNGNYQDPNPQCGEVRSVFVQLV